MSKPDLRDEQRSVAKPKQGLLLGKSSRQQKETWRGGRNPEPRSSAEPEAHEPKNPDCRRACKRSQRNDSGTQRESISFQHPTYLATHLYLYTRPQTRGRQTQAASAKPPCRQKRRVVGTFQRRHLKLVCKLRVGKRNMQQKRAQIKTATETNKPPAGTSLTVSLFSTLRDLTLTLLRRQDDRLWAVGRHQGSEFLLTGLATHSCCSFVCASGPSVCPPTQIVCSNPPHISRSVM